MLHIGESLLFNTLNTVKILIIYLKKILISLKYPSLIHHFGTNYLSPIMRYNLFVFLHIYLQC